MREERRVKAGEGGRKREGQGSGKRGEGGRRDTEGERERCDRLGGGRGEDLLAAVKQERKRV